MEKKNKTTKKTITKEKKELLVKTTTRKKTAFMVDVFDVTGKNVDQVELPKEIFGVTPNQNLISQAVRIYLANQRQGKADTKVRGEVRGGGRKPWKQKGTGRARIGSNRAPHWRGGGVIFGPTPRDYSLNFPKKMKKAALVSALSSKFADKGIIIIKDLRFKEAKTKQAVALLKNLNIINEKNMVVSGSFEDNEKRVLKNIAKTKLQKSSNLNVYEILNYKKVLITLDGIEKIESLIKGKNYSNG